MATSEASRPRAFAFGASFPRRRFGVALLPPLALLWLVLLPVLGVLLLARGAALFFRVAMGR
jgi:hypothetical protein